MQSSSGTITIVVMTLYIIKFIQENCYIVGEQLVFDEPLDGPFVIDISAPQAIHRSCIGMSRQQECPHSVVEPLPPHA